MTRPVCAQAIQIIKDAEQLELTCYRCPAGQPTIGWGSCKNLTEADIGKKTITVEEAETLLAEDVAYAADNIERAVVVPLTDNQFGALVSICFNTGPGAKGVKDGIITLKAGGPSTLLKRLNEGNYEAAAAEFPRWRKSGGKVLGGLVTRRAREKALFETPDGQEAVVPVPPKPPAPVSTVGSGAKVSMLAGAPAAWIVASLWNAVLPNNPMPLEVAAGVGSLISTGFYYLGDYLAAKRQAKEDTL